MPPNSNAFIVSPAGVAEKVEYLGAIPAEVPAGRIVVHNYVRPRRHLGSNGFRAWLAEPGDRYALCECTWAPELGEHYQLAQARP